jgi:hypothetical protein
MTTTSDTTCDVTHDTADTVHPYSWLDICLDCGMDTRTT